MIQMSVATRVFLRPVIGFASPAPRAPDLIAALFAQIGSPIQR
jgi:hypothetical protein